MVRWNDDVERLEGFQDIFCGFFSFRLVRAQLGELEVGVLEGVAGFRVVVEASGYFDERWKQTTLK
jgi:hypothetical protein